MTPAPSPAPPAEKNLANSPLCMSTSSSDKDCGWNDTVAITSSRDDEEEEERTEMPLQCPGSLGPPHRWAGRGEERRKAYGKRLLNNDE